MNINRQLDRIQWKTEQLSMRANRRTGSLSESLRKFNECMDMIDDIREDVRRIGEMKKAGTSMISRQVIHHGTECHYSEVLGRGERIIVRKGVDGYEEEIQRGMTTEYRVVPPVDEIVIVGV